jgi:hypothetical protein
VGALLRVTRGLPVADPEAEAEGEAEGLAVALGESVEEGEALVLADPEAESL